MRALAIPLVLVGFLGWTQFSSYTYVCKFLNQCEPAPTVVETPLLGLNENGKMALEGFDQFSFKENESKPDLSDNNKKFLDEVVAYMKANPDYKLRLTGNYLPGEKNKDLFNNMGESRAAAIRDLLVAKGISADRFDLKGNQLAAGASLDQPVSFDAIIPAPKEEGKEEIEYATAKQTFDDMVYYFDFGKADFNPDEPFKRYKEQVTAYLKDEANKGKKIQVIGHTDNIGSDAANMKLGASRAAVVKKFLTTDGVPANKVSSSSKGESQPAGPNDTEEQRQLNRRVNVKIQ